MTTALDLFCGAGGGTIGLKDAGYDDVVGVDAWRWAVETQRANGHACFEGEVGVETVEEIHMNRLPDVIFGGPPCQPFSQATKGEGHGDDRNGFPAMLDVVRVVRPRLVVTENVKALSWKKNRPYLNSLVKRFELLGYRVDWQVIDCSRLGLAQARKRTIIVARMDGEPRWPKPVPEMVTLADALRLWRYENQIASLPDWAHERPAPTVVGSFKPEILAAPRWRGPGDGPRQNAPDSVEVSEEEAAMLQGFPEGYTFCGPKTARWLQIGNASPPVLVQKVVEANRG